MARENRTIPPRLADRVAQVALDHFEKDLPQKAKPKDNEWTVYAAMVASTSRNCPVTVGKDVESSSLSEPAKDDDDDTLLWVVASATGTKCTAARCQGHILHDCHAEVLVRRGLVRVLWTEIVAAAASSPQSEPSSAVFTSSTTLSYRPLLELDPDATSSSGRKYRLRLDIQLHMYISDSPCGDASIYDILQQTEEGSAVATTISLPQFTGAKVIVSRATNISVEECGGSLLPVDGVDGNKNDNNMFSLVAREDGIQLLGKLRSKSGRSNLDRAQRSTSISCSDKLVRWGILGLQGHLLTAFITTPIRLTSLVVSRDHRVVAPETRAITETFLSSQEKALRRAVPERILAVEQSKKEPRKEKLFQGIALPDVFICDKVFAQGKSVVESLMSLPTRPAVSAGEANSERTSTEQSLSRKRKRGNQQESSSVMAFSPTGIASNWQQSDPSVELVIGARGVRQGKKPKVPEDYPKLQSRLCRASIMATLIQKSRLGVGSEKTSMSRMTYQEWKRDHGSAEWFEAKRYLVKNGPLAGWMVGSEEGDFEVRSKVKEDTSTS